MRQSQERCLLQLVFAMAAALIFSGCTTSAPEPEQSGTSEPPYDACAKEYHYGDKVEIIKPGDLRDAPGDDGKVVGPIQPGVYPGPIKGCYDTGDYVTLEIPGRGWVDADLTQG